MQIQWHDMALHQRTTPWCNILNHLNYFAQKAYRKDITRSAKTESKRIKKAKRKLNPVAWHGSAPARLTSAKSSILRSHLNRLIIIVATFLQTSCFLLLNSSFNPRSTLTFAYFLLPYLLNLLTLWNTAHALMLSMTACHNMSQLS